MIIFDDTLRTGIQLIDDEHECLIRLTNSLIDALSDDTTGNVHLSILELGNYCETHFSHEEELMSLVNYHSIDAHKFAHREFIDLQRHIRGAYDIFDQIINVKALVLYLEDWIKVHISVTDFAYVQLMNDSAPEVAALSKKMIVR